MVNIRVLNRLIVNLCEYLNDLEEIREKTNWEKFKTDKIIRRYVERTLHLAVQACIDIGSHIISFYNFREPVDNKDIFVILHENGIIDTKLAERLKKMAQFRNVIVYDYIKIKPEIVYSILKKDMEDIKLFLKAIKKNTSKNKKPGLSRLSFTLLF